MDKLLNEFVKVYKCKYNFSVVIGNDVFEMSTNACQPNGVNLYAGELDEYIFDPANEIPLADTGDEIKRAIVTRIKFEYYGFNETD